MRSCKATHRPMMRVKIRYNQRTFRHVKLKLSIHCTCILFGSFICVCLISKCFHEFSCFNNIAPMFSPLVFLFDDPCRRSRPGRKCCSWKMACRQDCHFPKGNFFVAVDFLFSVWCMKVCMSLCPPSPKKK